MNLIRHKTYFECGYPVNSNGDVPVIDTYIYLGTCSDVLGSDDEDNNAHIFQEVDYFFFDPEKAPPSWKKGEEKGLLLVKEQDLELIVDFDGLIEFLSECRARDDRYL